MNSLDFLLLIKEIYGKKLPNLKNIEKKGLLAVKIAQHFALRIDFLDEKVCTHLAKLYQNNVIIPEEQSEELMKKYCSEKWFSNFKLIEKTPFASASIGQVHRAELSDGSRVIIKIIKKDFKTQFIKDIAKLERFMRIVLFFYPKLSKVFDPIGILQNIKEYTLSELNLNDEINGQNRLNDIKSQYLNKYDLKKLKFPKIYENLTNENIMVAEYIEAESFDTLLSKGELTYKQMLELFSIHGFYIFGPGIFHGDIHPGNIILGKDNSIYFIDTSAISSVSEKIKKGLFGFFVSLSNNDFVKSAFFINEMAEKKLSGKKYEKFEEKFLLLYKDFKGSKVKEVSLTKKMMDTIKLGVNSGMEFEKGMFAIIKSLMYLDGMVLRCNPNAVLMDDIKGFVADLEKITDKT